MHSKNPGFEVLMLTFPSKGTQNQFFVNKFFFGKNQPDSNIPISEYSSSATTFTMHTFTENNIESDLKKYPLETFQGKNISEFIATNNSTKRQLHMEE